MSAQWVRDYAGRARAASRLLAVLTDGERAALVRAAADAVEHATTQLVAANAADMSAAESNGVPPHMLDRLMLNDTRIAAACGGMRDVADSISAVTCGDSVGGTAASRVLRSGPRLRRVRVPLGVVGMIYEARPLVTVDVAALTLGTANSIILRGGREALNSNVAIVDALRSALGVYADAVQLVTDTDRQSAVDLMKARGELDLLIPRGGAGLIRTVVENAVVPVIETGAGICHTYVHSAADLDMAVEILFNAKCSRPSVCNACETVLVDRAVAADFLPRAKARLDASAVRWKLCLESAQIVDGEAASDSDYETEWNDYILNCKIVDGIDEAIEHINTHGTRHSECIVTADSGVAAQFLRDVDAAAVYHNASTRFTDGFEFGLGAEIGISTQKLHARGPMGIEALLTYKYVLEGTGNVR